MAAGNPWNKFESIATCPICLGFFTDPMSLGCGHNLCRSCMDRHWGESPISPRCPECEVDVEPKHFIANWPLADFVEVVKEMNMEVKRPKEGRREKFCERHQQPLKLFCKDDETPICVGCQKSVEHRRHKVAPVEEVPEEYNNWLFLETARKMKEKVLGCQADSEKRRQKMVVSIAITGKEILMAELRRLHQFWGDQQKLLHSRVEESEKKLASVQGLIQEMEKKHQQPGGELLQDVRSFLQKYEKEMPENPITFPPEKISKVRNICNAIQILEDAMEKLGALTANMPVDLQMADLSLGACVDPKSMTRK